MKFSLINNTNQQYPSEQIYFAIIGNNASDQTCYLDKDGTLIPCHVSDNDAPGHLTKNGQKDKFCPFLVGYSLRLKHQN